MKKIASILVRSALAGCLLCLALGGCAPAAPEQDSSLAGDSRTDATPTLSHQPKSLDSSDGANTEGLTSSSIGTPYEEPPVPYNTEEYAAMRENGFLSVAANPFSTFSADVDTASYCNLRRMLSSGTKLNDIPKGAVRIEEILNYFRYDYRAPKDAEPFGVTPCISTCPWNPDTKLLVLGLSTEPKEYAQMHGNNLVFLIDSSGSMEDPEKMPLLKESMGELVANLNDDDTVSIVTYAGSERVVLEGAKARERERILQAVRELDANGSTNGQAGLAKAYELARAHFIEGGNNRIILASDGDLNVGITSQSELSDYVSQQRKSGVYLSVLGFGQGNYKDTKMESIADDGNGNYSYIDSIQEAKRVFGEDLCATMRTVADDVKLQVEFNPAYVKGYRLIGYENRSLNAEDFKNDKVDAGEVGSGHAVTVAYEIVTADSPMQLLEIDSKYGGGERKGEKNGEWMTLSVRYKNPGENDSKQLSYGIGEADVTDQPSDNWKFASAVIEFGMVATKSEHAGTASFDGAIALMDQMGALDDRQREFKKLVSIASL